MQPVARGNLSDERRGLGADDHRGCDRALLQTFDGCVAIESERLDRDVQGSEQVIVAVTAELPPAGPILTCLPERSARLLMSARASTCTSCGQNRATT